MTFEQWMAAVDERLLFKIGLVHDDISDQTWHDWFDAGWPVHEAVHEALTNEGILL
ncbi:hypothetical protein PBI_AN9_91 [Mycobacterium phage AN9]|nr:hypothetical protein PBI_VC3_90 [Mycobacterium phage VC3]QJD52553.1 hypothetical protein PBI_ANI8_91 [Mycobacterium phage ANI8]QJD52645.1 hypothetical protein PBI_AN9_91 [Mycobacterium phage AN9]BBC43645.1 hypothetical protein [Mycobacterium phage C3]